jgi:3-dehydroquinate dehydratase-2
MMMPDTADTKALVMCLNGPNLNLLGQREPHLYGHTTLASLEASLMSQADMLGVRLLCLQSNHEGQLIDWVHQYRRTASGWMINAGGYTHTSIALADALRSVEAPIVEVHISQIHQREAYRKHSYIAEVAQGMICGLGVSGYGLALQYLCQEKRNTTP